MHIQVNHDRNIEGSAKLNEHVEEILNDSFSRFSSMITRIEVHLSDENGPKNAGGMDKKCLLEARISHRAPMVVSAMADSVHQALDGAAAKLQKSMDAMMDKLHEHSNLEVTLH